MSIRIDPDGFIPIVPVKEGQKLPIEKIYDGVSTFLGKKDVSSYSAELVYYPHNPGEDDVMALTHDKSDNFLIHLWNENVDGKDMTVVEVTDNMYNPNIDSCLDSFVSCKFYFCGDDFVSATAVIIPRSVVTPTVGDRESSEKTGLDKIIVRPPDSTMDDICAYTITYGKDKILSLNYYDMDKIAKIAKRFPDDKRAIFCAGGIDALLDRDPELAEECMPSKNECAKFDASLYGILDLFNKLHDYFYNKDVIAHDIENASPPRLVRVED